MSVKQVAVLLISAILSIPAYAQKGVGKAVETAVQRQVVNRAKLPTLRDGVRNWVMYRLGNIPYVSDHNAWGGAVATHAWVNYPTHSILAFGKKMPQPQRREKAVKVIDMRAIHRAGDFYQAAKPGAGDVQAIALPAYGMMKQAIISRYSTLTDQLALLQMAQTLDNGFAMSIDGNWNFAHGCSFNRFHDVLNVFRVKWEVLNKAYGGSGVALSREIGAILDVLEIQAWVLENGGYFPQIVTNPGEGALVQKFDNLMQQVAKDASFARDPAVQVAVQHLVHLRAAAKGTQSPGKVVLEVLKWRDEGKRIPGSSLERVSAQENVLTQELNYVEQLRRANLLYLLVPAEQTQSLIAFYLEDFQKQGYIYRQMIKMIPEFAADGATLNVPTYTQEEWDRVLSDWKRAHGNVSPRVAITGRFGLPLNFNDLTPEEQAEVLLGTYLRIKDK